MSIKLLVAALVGVTAGLPAAVALSGYSQGSLRTMCMMEALGVQLRSNFVAV
jgi:hypothetical protein